VQLVAENASGTSVGGQVSFATPAQAASPLVATGSAEALSATTAKVEGNADPEGQATTLHADFALATDQWCLTGGEQGLPMQTAPAPLGAGNAMLSEVSVTVEGLTPGSGYCVQLVAENASGTSVGGQVSFATPAQAASAPLTPALSVVELEAGSPASPPPLSAPPSSSPGSDYMAPAMAPKMPTSAQKLSRALKVCARKARRLRARCVREAHRRYGKTARRARR
jgi:hypothetical protein